ncbi:hypothetical protein KR767_11020 [Luteibacter anthropi]|uniref:Holin n=1 Tax=Luteibacter anthropi TaxID=564369 RepID=A0A7X5U9Z1_9GAMM|nr:hypothetical protein [Luteibacter anthropi]NII06428.1 hypothetical protein [Luteibacter anthropi]URX60642.1 hypothetical protein KR767_11020 [Luteibacter anthropi]
MITKDLAAESGVALARLTPPAAVVTASASGYSLQDWTYIGTLAFLLMQGAYLAWKWWREWHYKRLAP